MRTLLIRRSEILAWAPPMAVALFGGIYGAFHRMHRFPAYCFIVAGALSIVLNVGLLLWQGTRDPGWPKRSSWVFCLGIVAGVLWFAAGGAFLGWFPW